MSASLQARNLTAHFDDLHAFGPVSFTIQAGQFVSIVGPSGCGKSTLIRAFAGLQRPSSGAAYIDGQPVEGPSPLVGLMFQSANLMPWRSVLDNIALPLELAGVGPGQRQESARALLPMLGLEGFETAYPGALSGGMAQRVALGRVLIGQPAVLLLDEPFGALDALTREQISMDLLRMWSQERQTAVMVTHDINEAVLLSDRVLVMSRRPGRILADIPVDLPRPRDLDMIYDPAFARLAKAVRSAING
ncbi:MAG: ABC transporter ATP-binding protein [Chloroflexota bacterium]